MNINLNPDVPEDSIDKYVMDTIVEGTEGAEPIYVPPHWHKVGFLPIEPRTGRIFWLTSGPEPRRTHDRYRRQDRNHNRWQEDRPESGRATVLYSCPCRAQHEGL